MLYLFSQIYLWILAAFFLGMLAQWFFCCRNKKEDTESETLTAVVASEASEPLTVIKTAQASVDDSWKPKGFTDRPDDADELKRIKGIGAVIEETLNQLGIYQFKQIAAWDSNNIAWVEKFLAFPGRIGREEWISQAQTLGEGGTTEFAKRVDKGDISYD